MEESVFCVDEVHDTPSSSSLRPPHVLQQQQQQQQSCSLASVAVHAVALTHTAGSKGSAMRDEQSQAQQQQPSLSQHTPAPTQTSATVRWRPLVPERRALDKTTGTALPQPLHYDAAATTTSASLQQQQQQHSDAHNTTLSSHSRHGDDSGSDSSASSSSQEHDTASTSSLSSTAAERRFVDEFGFVLDERAAAQDARYVRSIDGKQVARREAKWADMAANWERTHARKFATLKERCRKGVPSRLRGVAWQLLLGSRHQMNLPENAGVYAALRDKALADREVDATIARDRARTFPHHVLFQQDGGEGQTFLCNVLHAYAACDPEVGYVQGMAFLVAALSTQMGEEECFWALHALMYGDRYKMRELYKPGFPMLQQFFYQLRRLLARLLPRLSHRFAELEVDPSFYAAQWFLTLFVYHFPFRSLLRIWDVFMCEGWKVVFRTAIALMQWEEERLLTLPFDELLPALKTLQDGKDMRAIMHRAHRVKFKTADLHRYGDEYWQQQRRQQQQQQQQQQQVKRTTRGE